MKHALFACVVLVALTVAGAANTASTKPAANTYTVFLGEQRRSRAASRSCRRP